LANDHPEDVAKALVDEGKASDDFVDSCPAVGCYISGAQPWLATLNRNEGGGGTENERIDDQLEAGRMSPSGIKKRIGDQLKSDRMTIRRKGLTAPGTDFLKDIQSVVKVKNQETGPPRKKIREDYGSKDKLPSTTTLKDNKGSKVTISTTTINCDVLTATADAAKAIQEQKAVKSDDAAVPVHLWEDHLFDKPGWAKKWENDLHSFRKACSILKSMMIRWWKRTVTRSLSVWIDNRYPHIRGQFDDSKSVVKIETQMLERVNYSWSEGGRAMYSK
jgi:hypothetical protein